jgi:phosphoglucomutase
MIQIRVERQKGYFGVIRALEIIVDGTSLGRINQGQTLIFDAPDGWNINDDCGSTHLHQLRTAVIREGADFGIAHDGDADRALAIDAQ